ncbi:hemocyte protein-glutamine gamma-glutamyltransferase-like [Mya arenaria]|uniref:hemocyte protein-glutamine gamma-glutamyltransferase-like n=1 Tax=Mya arenaria TaxID=6604 RepID=UPI0022E8E135|nr:hemocyte protein-glutamine gamma-glutamyltransferase-like [Mya arenaria]
MSSNIRSMHFALSSGRSRTCVETSSSPASSALRFRLRNLYGKDVWVCSNQSNDDVADPKVLQVHEVDLDIRQNTHEHHTNEFDITDSRVYDSREVLVIRRGQTFLAHVTFNRAFDPNKDDLKLVFEYGKCPLASKGTRIELIMSDKDVSNEWGAWIESSEDALTSLQILTPPKLAIGKWKLKIDVIKREESNKTTYRYVHKDPIYILFNPWCEDDSVYMRDEGGKLLREYILNETGKIYVGNKKKISPRMWVFGQFTGDVLDCALSLLDQAKIRDQARSNPVVIARKLSALVNSSNGNGVLMGNWDGDYTGGTSPLEWTGSCAILEQYFRTKEPVRYGQCWVFSGVLTSVCRALGIPARSVTNFSSAHDTDGSISIDTHFNTDGEPLEKYNKDSVWNFHVWNDVWMARPDLPVGYGGWQAVDATPQEASDGVYCMGPTSLRAIREGKVSLQYDGPFLFSEVNADEVYWMVEEDGSMDKRMFQNSVEKAKITDRDARHKKLCSDVEREDVTDQYKFQEGSEEERAAVREANLHSTVEGIYETADEDVEFQLCYDIDTFVGEEIKVTLTAQNNSATKRTVMGTLVLGTAYYTGVFHKELLKQKVDVVLEPNKEKELEFKVDAGIYLDNLVDHCIITISCFCFVKETRQHYIDRDELRLRKPTLTIKAPVSADNGQSFKVDVSFENKLPVPLTRCELRVEGPGLQKPVIYRQRDVNAKGTFIATFQMTPVKSGKRDVVVYFNSRQISGVTACHSIQVLRLSCKSEVDGMQLAVAMDDMKPPRQPTDCRAISFGAQIRDLGSSLTTVRQLR